MKQVLRKGLKEMVVEEVPVPFPGAHHLLIAPVFSLISSGTETASIHQHGALKAVADNPSHLRKVWNVMMAAGPVGTVREVMAKFGEYAALGYSGAGIVVDKHATVTDLEVGDPVAYGGEGTGHAENIVTGRNLAVRIPDGVRFEHACFATLGSIAMNAIRVSGIGIGDVVAVIGQGLVGQLVTQLVRAQGGVAIAMDLREDRVALARKLGAEYGVGGEQSPIEAVRSITGGRGADAVIVAAAAKSAAPAKLALDICRDRGKIIVVGAVEMQFPWNDMYLKEIQLYMSRAYGPGSYDPAYEKKGQDYPIAYIRWTENRNMGEFLRLVKTGQIQLDPLITHRFPLDRAPEAYSTILDPGAGSLAVLLEYPEKTPPAGNADDFRRTIPIAAGEPKAGTPQFALVGGGNIARWAHMPALEKAGGALRAMYSASGVRGKSYGSRYRVAYATTDYHEVLRDAAVDAVIVVTRNQEHARQTVQALEAGKHVFVEKPMALTVEECAQVVRASRESGKQVAVGFNRRFAPYYVAQKKYLKARSGPAVVQCRMNSPGISGGYWMADPSIGGAILGEACHFVDLMYWLLDSEPVAVSAFSLPTGKGDPIGENNLVASFRFADGSIGNLTYCTVGSSTSGGERVEVFAQGIGVFTENFKKLDVRRGIPTAKSKIWGDKGYDQQMGAFVQSLRDGQPRVANAIDGARSTLCCLRMLESAKALAPMPIDLASVTEE